VNQLATVRGSTAAPQSGAVGAPITISSVGCLAYSSSVSEPLRAIFRSRRPSPISTLQLRLLSLAPRGLRSAITQLPEPVPSRQPQALR